MVASVSEANSHCPRWRLVRASSGSTRTRSASEERLKEQEAEGVRMPDGMPLDELALRVLIAAELARGR